MKSGRGDPFGAKSARISIGTAPGGEPAGGQKFDPITKDIGSYAVNIRVKTLILTAATCAASFGQIVLPSGTKITCRLDQTISSATAEEGQAVQLSVSDNVRVNGVVVIPQGAAVVGSVVLAQGKRSMGRTGKLDFSIDKVRAVDGEQIPLRYTMQKKEGGSKGVSTGVMTAGVAVVFWPAAPFILLRKGKDVTINRGMTFEVFTDQDHVLQNTQLSAVMPPGPTPQLQYAAAASTPPAPGMATMHSALAEVNITSDLPGAEVEVDGSFVGSTPSAVKLAPGMHRVTVKHGSALWSRDLNVQPNGNINVNAILRK
jgi:hypothetical protein